MSGFIDLSNNLLLQGGVVSGLSLLKGVNQYDMIVVNPRTETDMANILEQVRWKHSTKEIIRQVDALLHPGGIFALEVRSEDYWEMRGLLELVFTENGRIASYLIPKRMKSSPTETSSIYQHFSHLLVYCKESDAGEVPAFYPKTPRVKGTWTLFKERAFSQPKQVQTTLKTNPSMKTTLLSRLAKWKNHSEFRAMEILPGKESFVEIILESNRRDNGNRRVTIVTETYEKESISELLIKAESQQNPFFTIRVDRCIGSEKQ